LREKLQTGLRAAKLLLALKAAVGGFAAALAAYGISVDYLGYDTTVLAQGGVSSVGALIAVVVALRA
jgi:hypothetical protein